MGKTVLVIDDNPLIRSFVETVLTHAGWTVVVAPTGQSGLDVSSAIRLDLIMLDFMLPDMSGARVLDVLRQRRLSAPVMMMTGKGDIQTVKVCISGGAAGYLVKPFSPNDLLARVHATLNPRRAAPATATSANAVFL